MKIISKKYKSNFFLWISFFSWRVLALSLHVIRRTILMARKKEIKPALLIIRESLRLLNCWNYRDTARRDGSLIAPFNRQFMTFVSTYELFEFDKFTQSTLSASRICNSSFNLMRFITEQCFLKCNAWELGRTALLSY